MPSQERVVYRARVTYSGNGSTITDDDCDVEGNYNTVKGNRCTVSGVGNIVHGEGCDVRGDASRVYGRRCKINGGIGHIVTGDECEVVNVTKSTVTGCRCLITGWHNTSEGNECIIDSWRGDVSGNNCVVSGWKNTIHGRGHRRVGRRTPEIQSITQKEFDALFAARERELRAGRPPEPTPAQVGWTSPDGLSFAMFRGGNGNTYSRNKLTMFDLRGDHESA